MGVVIYNGQSSEDFGLHVTYRPDYDLPVRDVEEITLPGRDGTILYDNGRYDKTERKYAMTFGDEDVDFYDMVVKMSKWLNSSPSKYVRLSDSYEPDVYRLARFVPDGPILPVLENAGGLEVKFECLPQRFYKEGDIPLKYEIRPIGENLFDADYDQEKSAYKIDLISGDYYLIYPFLKNPQGNALAKMVYYVNGTTRTVINVKDDGSFTSPITGTGYLELQSVYDEYLSVLDVHRYHLPDFFITNYTGYQSKPIIKIIPQIDLTSTTYGVYSFNINDYKIDIDTREFQYNGPIVLDCEQGDCYSSGITPIMNLNNGVTFTKNGNSSSFPVFEPGRNQFSFRSMSYEVNVEVTPKWWTI